MSPGARIILCNAEPHWIYQATSGEADRTFRGSNLQFLEDKVLRRRVAVFLSGDLHHYRRHSDDHGHHKIVAGGGGAFLHPTHDADVASVPGASPEQPYMLRCSYPEVATSRALTRRNFLFPLLNPRFGLLTALLYLLTCRAVQVDLSGLGLGDLATAAGRVVDATLRGPTALLWVAAAVAGVVLFADGASTRFRVVGGLAHAAAHLAAAFFLGWGASWLVARWSMPLALDLLSTGALVFGAGWLVGSLVMGTYLYVSLNGFGRHRNEAFSSLAIADWKNLLRLHVDEHGALRIYPIGIDRVPRRWREAPDGPRLVSCDPAATPPRLIEPPIAVPGSGRAPGASAP